MDEDILHTMDELGLDKVLAKESLEDKCRNHLTATYFLLEKAKWRHRHPQEPPPSLSIHPMPGSPSPSSSSSCSERSASDLRLHSVPSSDEPSRTWSVGADLPSMPSDNKE